jgi:hypothetical protein
MITLQGTYRADGRKHVGRRCAAANEHVACGRGDNLRHDTQNEHDVLAERQQQATYCTPEQQRHLQCTPKGNGGCTSVACTQLDFSRSPIEQKSAEFSSPSAAFFNQLWIGNRMFLFVFFCFKSSSVVPSSERVSKGLH